MTQNHSRAKFILYDLQQDRIDSLRFYLGTVDWSCFLCCDDVQIVYDQLITVLEFFIQSCIPVRSVRLGKRNPNYITPIVQLHLNKNNKLRRRRCYTAANKLASNINEIIAGTVRNRLNKLAEAPINAIWKALKLNYSSHDCSVRTRHLLSHAEKVNEYFAGISFSQFYNTENVTAFRPTSPSDCHDYHPIYAYDIERMLSKVSKTAPGPDNLPHWIFKFCSYELA
jgi:hypothetical protein